MNKKQTAMLSLSRLQVFLSPMLVFYELLHVLLPINLDLKDHIEITVIKYRVIPLRTHSLSMLEINTFFSDKENHCYLFL